MDKLPKCKDIPRELWCPANSSEIELKVYRFTSNSDKVCSDDFLSKYEIDKKCGKDTKRLSHLDTYYGLSMIEDYEEAKKYLKKVKGKNFKGIAKGITYDGLVRKTASRDLESHVTWWPYETAINIETRYIIVGGNENE